MNGALHTYGFSHFVSVEILGIWLDPELDMFIFDPGKAD